jgi:outer membrane lipase/esterase
MRFSKASASTRAGDLSWLFAVLLIWLSSAHAQTAPGQPAPSLAQMVTTLRSEGVFQFDGLEYDAAVANDAAYAALLPICTPTPTTTTAACAGNTLALFMRLRELEDNANQLLGQGEQQYSLRLAPEALGAALRWTAPEEYAAQGSMATRFANSQASVLNNRFSALRFATRSFPLAQTDSNDGDDSLASAAYGPLGGSAGDDIVNASFGRLSIFANGSFGTGDKSPTTFEDAFSFDDTEASFGADYRLSNRWVVGILASHTEKRVDFNSELSIVNGAIRGNGQGGLLYAQFEGDAVYVNGSIGLEHLSLGTVRRITYPSNNPDIASVNATSTSDTGSNTLTATLAAGYVFHYRGFSAEPYLNGQYDRVRINGFTEHSGEGFDFDVAEQTIHSSEIAAGLKFQYAVLPPFGVIVPYVYGEYRRQLSDSSRTVGSSYAAVAGDGDTTGMDLPTDAAPTHYYVVGGGGSIVLKHGLQGFIQYMRVLQYANYTDHVVSGGVRWEF